MAYSKYGLSFEELRAGNVKRLPKFKNAKGEIAHPHPTGADWSPGDWMTAIVGELGEAANIMKKVRRGDYALDDVVTFKEKEGPTTPRKELAKEFADVACYLDILAMQFDVDLGDTIVEKFNEVSARFNCDVKLP